MDWFQCGRRDRACAILGAISIPAIFSLGSLAFRSLLVGQMAAAIMAVSPYGIYLAQEARHYTLAILLLIASLCCLVIATRTIHRRMPLPIDNRVTQWIYDGNLLNGWLETIARVLAWTITMLSLLPVEGTNLPIMLASGAVLVIFVSLGSSRT